MRISDWSSDVCSSDLGATASRPLRPLPGSSRTAREPGSRPCILSGLYGLSKRYCAAFRHKLNDRASKEFSAGTRRATMTGDGAGASGGRDLRSEEHPSELQSLMRISFAAFWLTKTKKQ